MSSTSKFSFVAAALILALAGCGGGGSSAPTSSAPAPVPPAPVPQAQWKPVVTSVAAPMYGGDNLLAFNLLNSVRAATGAGLLTQNSFLDKSATSHVAYLFNYRNYFSSGISFHAETAGNIGFTGATIQARAAAAGYAGQVTEDGTDLTGRISSNTIGAVGYGDFAVHTLLNNSVYHRFSLLSSWTDIGVSVVTDKSNPPQTFAVLNLGNSSALSLGQLPAAPLVYPYANQTGVDTTFVPASESPNPAPDLGEITIGLPVTVELDSIRLGGDLQKIKASDLVILSFTITAQGNSTPVTSRTIAAAGVTAGSGFLLTKDPVGFMTPSQVCLLPLTPLAMNTAYNAVFNATVKGQPVNLAWSFTTGTNK